MRKDNKNNDWKERLNIVYSTNPNFHYETETEQEESKKQADDAKQPELRYYFGDENDFQLQQAVRILKGEKYVTGFEKKPEKVVAQSAASATSDKKQNKK